MLECPKCNGNHVIKSGKIKGRQRYKCKPCSYFYTVKQKSDTSTAGVRRFALTMYLEGMGFRSIGRSLGFSHVAVYQWIKSFGEQVEAVKSSKPAKIVEIDELHSHVGYKKTIAGSGLLLIDMESDFCMLSPGVVGHLQASDYGQN